MGSQSLWASGVPMPMKLDRRTKEHFWRLFLRSIPLPFFSAGPELFDLLRDVRRTQSDFDRQVADAVEGLRTTSELVTTLQKGVEEKMAQLQALQKEHAKYSELAQIEAKKAEALLKQVEDVLGREQKKERWIALAMHLGAGFLFFALGVFLSDSFKNTVHSLWTALRAHPQLPK